MSTTPRNGLFSRIAIMALPFGSNLVPTARLPSLDITLVAMRMKSLPDLTNRVAVPPTVLVVSRMMAFFCEGAESPNLKLGNACP